MNAQGISAESAVWAAVSPIQPIIKIPLVFYRVDGKPFMVLRGANGSGKSTLLRAMIGLDGGEGARLITRDDSLFTPRSDRSLIRYMPQEPDEALFPRLSVGDNIRMLSLLLRIPSTFGNTLHLNERLTARQLSLGQKKLLLLDAILQSLPPPGVRPIVFVLLDEPLAGLDSRNSALFCERLNVAAGTYANTSNVSFVIVDHGDIETDGESKTASYEIREGVAFQISHMASLRLRE